MQVNGGAVVNYGHELSITTRPVISTDPKGFNWTFSINGALNKGILTELPGNAPFYLYKDNVTGQSMALKVGRNPLSNYLYDTKGIYVSNSQVPVDPITGVRMRASNASSGIYFQAGDPMWADLNGDYLLSDADYIITGNPDPLVTGGLNTTFSYHYFSLNVNASYLLKRSILNNAMSYRLNRLRYSDKTSFDNKPVNVYDYSTIDYWKTIGVNSSNPVLVGSYEHDDIIQPNRQNQSLFQEDGSYLKINQITLAYQFRDFDFMKRMKLRFLRAFVTAYNIGMFSKYSGPNPETVTSLGRDDINGYPNATSYTIGIGAQF
jgi:hypothetical protein